MFQKKDECEVRRCNREYEVTYLGKNLCWQCWSSKCKRDMNKEVK